MSAYLLVRVTIDDPEAYGEYMRRTPRIIAQYEGRMIIRGGEVATLEGPEERRRIVVIEFPSMERAKAFYASAQYQRAKTLRQGAGQAQFFVVEAYPSDQWQAAVTESQRHALEG